VEWASVHSFPASVDQAQTCFHFVHPNPQVMLPDFSQTIFLALQ